MNYYLIFIKKSQEIFNKLKNNKLVEDSFWSLLGNVIGRGLALVAGVFIARILGSDVYGEYGIIRTTILTIAIFSTFGLGYTATKYIAEFRVKDLDSIPVFVKLANKVTLSFSGIMALLLFIFSEFISNKWLSAPHLGSSLKMLSILIVFNAITTTQIGILSGFGRFKIIAKINALMGVLIFLFSLVLTYFYELNGALLALLIVQTLNCIFNYIYVRKEIKAIPASVADYSNMLRKILLFSSPIALQEATYSIVSWSAILLLIKFSTYSELGLYTAAMHWNAIILFIPGILRNVVLSHLSSANDSFSKHNILLKQTLIINVISTIIPCLIVFIMSALIAKAYGKSFDGLSGLISIAIFSTVFQSISNVYTQAYMSLGKNWLVFYIKSAVGVASLVFIYVMMNSLGFQGAKSLIYSELLFGFLYAFILLRAYTRTENHL